MIKKIYASDSRFKSIEFRKGLNIIVAEKREESGKKDTRNGSGKTTLINVIHFCFGADVKKLKLPIEQIKNWSFYIELELWGRNITAKRSIEKPAIVEIKGEIDLAFFNQGTKDNEKLIYKIEDWKKLLGKALFNLQESSKQKYRPSFRSLISYFIRREAVAYSDPFRHFFNQSQYDFQLCHAFLLGLNWEPISEIKENKEKKKAMDTLQKAIQQASQQGVILSQGELEAERVRLEQDVQQEKDAIKTFQVLPQYKEVQKKADEMTANLHKKSNQLFILNRKIRQYQEAIAKEVQLTQKSVEELYAEVGYIFEGKVKKTLDQAKKFHFDVVENRKTFIQEEIENIQIQIKELETERKRLIEERGKLLEILESHGALDEFYTLQQKNIEKQAMLEGIKSKLSDLKNISTQRTEIKRKILEIETKVKRDYELMRPKWERAVSLFTKNTLALYTNPGNFIINTSETGYKFEINMPRDGSEGIEKMKIFCYDLMLLELLSQENKINFLIHDSTIFESVDSRQCAQALEYVQKKCTEQNMQYICAINSDKLPQDEISENFNIKSFIRLSLGDKDPSDLLMGFHF